MPNNSTQHSGAKKPQSRFATLIHKYSKFTPVTELSAEEMREFTLTSRNCYSTVEMPEHFRFDKVLDFVKTTVADRPYADCKTSDFDMHSAAGINHTILLNKDGRYGVRPLTLTNPYSYYFLVREMFADDNWEAIKLCFSHCTVDRFDCASMPVKVNGKEEFHMAGVILNSWWKQFEQRSIALSLDYKYMFVTDITNCYGTITTYDIERALTLRDTKHESHSNTTLAQNINTILQDMQVGQTACLPQGSMIFDILAEIVLGYADLLLYERLATKKKSMQYQVLRYRDDYRIFCNDKEDLDLISYELQHVLESLNLRMNPQKTRMSHSIITDSIKADKLDYIYNTPISSHYHYDFDGLQKHLLFILLFARKHPNGTYVKSLLSDFNSRVGKMLSGTNSSIERLALKFAKSFVDADTAEDQFEALQRFTTSIVSCLDRNKTAAYADDSPLRHPRDITSHLPQLTAIATAIAAENITVCPNALQVISSLAKTCKKGSTEWLDIIRPVYHRLYNLHNSQYQQLWLQSITYAYDISSDVPFIYDLPLCQVAMNEPVELWNNSWLIPSLTDGFPTAAVVDSEKLRESEGEIKTLGHVNPYEFDDFFDDLDDTINFDEDELKGLDDFDPNDCDPDNSITIASF